MRLKLLPILILSAFLLSVVALGSLSSPVQSAFNNVVINEVQIAGDVVEDEFVELFNPTGSAIDITGWRLTRNTESGASESNLVASLTGSVPANGHFLVANDDFNGGVTVDQQYSVVGNNIASNNSVTLYSDAGVTVVDRVGFGTSTLFEGAAVATNPPANGSAQRTGQDTENNAADFGILEVSTPTNSGATPSPTSTATPTEEPTDTPPTPTPTPTESPEPTDTPEPTESPSPTPTVSASPTPTPGPVLGFSLECSLRVKVFSGRFVTLRMPILHCEIVR